MSKSQEAPPDSWDMDTNDTSQITQGDTSDLSSVTSALTAVSLNVNAPAFVPNINAPAFVPSMIPSVPPPNEQMSPVSAVPGGYTAPIVSLNAATVQNGNYETSNAISGNFL